MNRPKPEEPKCRRQEFKCKLYDIIKQLDRSLKSDCAYSTNKAQKVNRRASGSEHKQKGTECCCPPGCCKDSLKFRMPKLLPIEKVLALSDPTYADTEDGPDSGHQESGGTGYLGWHDEDHSWGCRPVGENWPGARWGRYAQTGGDNGTDMSPSSGMGGGNVEHGGGRGNYDCCQNNGGGLSYGADVGYSRNIPQQDFRFPETPEQALQMGCFVARSA